MSCDTFDHHCIIFIYIVKCYLLLLFFVYFSYALHIFIYFNDFPLLLNDIPFVLNFSKHVVYIFILFPTIMATTHDIVQNTCHFTQIKMDNTSQRFPSLKTPVNFSREDSIIKIENNTIKIFQNRNGH